MLNGYKKNFNFFGGQMEEILVIIYLLSCYLLDQPRTGGINSFILIWTISGPPILSVFWTGHQKTILPFTRFNTIDKQDLDHRICATLKYLICGHMK